MDINETLADLVARHSGPPNAAWHVEWTGRRDSHGRPIVKHADREFPVAALVFQQRTGRKPVGTCRADCDVRHCVSPTHVVDDIERRTYRLQLRKVYGWAAPWDVCQQGHSWEEHGRVEPDLTIYCKQCGTNRSNRLRAAERDSS
jgi:hypothetical protein